MIYLGWYRTDDTRHAFIVDTETERFDSVTTTDGTVPQLDMKVLATYGGPVFYRNLVGDLCNATIETQDDWVSVVTEDKFARSVETEDTLYISASVEALCLYGDPSGDRMDAMLFSIISKTHPSLCFDDTIRNVFHAFDGQYRLGEGTFGEYCGYVVRDILNDRAYADDFSEDLFTLLARDNEALFPLVGELDGDDDQDDDDFGW